MVRTPVVQYDTAVLLLLLYSYCCTDTALLLLLLLWYDSFNKQMVDWSRDVQQQYDIIAVRYLCYVRPTGMIILVDCCRV